MSHRPGAQRRRRPHAHETIAGFFSLWIYTMKRCSPLAAAALALGLLVGSSAHAQSVQRPFPKEALRGTLTVVQPPYVQMDDRTTRLAPGARIRGTDNNLMRPAALVKQELTVNYTMDRKGQVQEVWVLTEQEAKEKRATLGVERNYRFESQQSQSPSVLGTADATR